MNTPSTLGDSQTSWLQFAAIADVDAHLPTNEEAASIRKSIFDRDDGQSIALFLLQASHVDAYAIRLALENDAKHRVCLVENIAAAQVVLIDCDRPGADGAMRQVAMHGKDAIGYASNPKEQHKRFPNIIVLGKPIKIDELIQALTLVSAVAIKAPSRPVEQVTTIPKPTAPAAAHRQAARPFVDAPSRFGESLSGENIDICGSNGDIAGTRSGEPPAKLFFHPEHYLLGPLLRAVRESKTTGLPRAVVGLPRMIRVASTPEAVCRTDFSHNRLRPASMTQLPRGAVLVVPDPGPCNDEGKETLYATRDLLWNVAIWAARGRLPKGSDPYQPVFLRAIPDFTRCFAPPYAETIATLWARKFASPVEIATELGIPQRYVFAFFTAARFAGLLDKRADAAALDSCQNARSSAAPANRCSLAFSRIVRKLINAL
ncbi:MAG TPA: hypothetical protein PLS67_11830 [Accumulibacter sp.]|jgi:hypothetical protein|nr:hypothetical protein [Accumulibacter sp.]HQC81185.1 hypothetical protein [Accumulibacter sp.]